MPLQLIRAGQNDLPPFYDRTPFPLVRHVFTVENSAKTRKQFEELQRQTLAELRQIAFSRFVSLGVDWLGSSLSMYREKKCRQNIHAFFKNPQSRVDQVRDLTYNS